MSMDGQAIGARAVAQTGLRQLAGEMDGPRPRGLPAERLAPAGRTNGVAAVAEATRVLRPERPRGGR